MSDNKLIIPVIRWAQIIQDLRSSSKNRRESGAFLLGREERVLDHIPYDRLDPKVANSGIIDFDCRHYIELWQYCSEHNLSVIADVHTHPGSWTRMSESDRTHPMISTMGHIALIVPNYAKKNLKSLRGVGKYEYQGDYKWKDTSKVKLVLL